MKKIRYIYLILLAFTVFSCKDFLDEQPIDELSADQFWKSEGDIRAGIAGMYDGIQSVIDNRYIDWGGGRSDSWTNGGTGTDEISFALNGLTANMNQVEWDQLYSTINRANLALKYLPEINGGDISETEKDNYLAQAYAMRAYCHFLGVKVWGDVPLMLESVTDRDYKPVRTPVGEVLNSVVDDLNKALTLVDRENTNVFEINIGGIQAILTDVYMWQHEYQKAIDASNALLDLGWYSLAETPKDWKTIFTDPGNSTEAIWSVFWALEEDGSNGISGKIGSSTNTSPYIMDPNLLAKWEQQKNDFRRFLTYDTLQAVSEGAVQDIWKYYPLAASGLPSESLPETGQTEVQNSMYRLSDILLLRAEAFNHLGDKAKSVELLNQIKVRAGLAPVTADMFASEDELEMAILDERQLELFAEAKRWFDLRRTGRVVEVMDPLLRQRQENRGLTVTGFGDPGLVLFPISRDALNENPNLEQNPPYSR